MDENERRRRMYGWLLLVVGVVVIIGFVIATFLQKPAPPGKEMVGKTPPAKHWADACFRCHRGMPPAPAVVGKPLPANHPTAKCDTCHKGYEAVPLTSDTKGGRTPGSAPTAPTGQPTDSGTK